MSPQTELGAQKTTAEIEAYIKQFVSTNGHRPRALLEWPDPIGEAAYHGVIGEIVRAVAPHTEASLDAVLVQLPVFIGSQMGRDAYFTASGGRQGPNLFAVIVGSTSEGAKGASTDSVKYVINGAFPGLNDRIDSGLNSGQGLISRLRDPIPDPEDEDKIKDPGVTDKRLLLIEEEFSKVFVNKKRDGAILAEVLQQAWDGKDLRNLTIGSKDLKVTGPHVSFVGHTTPAVLRKHMTNIDHEGGFSNRILWACSRYSKDLPDDEVGLEGVDWGPIHEQLRDAVDLARSGHVRKIGFNAEALELFTGVYKDLRGRGAGVLGAITARGRPQVRKLAMIYALLDFKAEVELPHLLAALEIWRYSIDSCRYILGELTGNPLADEILVMLRESATEGLTRTEIRNAFFRHKDGLEIGAALELLEELGLADMKKEETDGRPAERWFAKEKR